MIKFLKKLPFYLLITFLLVVLGYFSYLAYVETNCSAAKEYLIKKYELNEKEIKSKKYTEYVYEDIADCNTLWFKECTDDQNLLYTYTFVLSNNAEVVVYEDTKGNYTDNYIVFYEGSNENSSDNNNDDSTTEENVENSGLEENTENKNE